MAGTSIRLLALTTVPALALAGCEPGAGPVTTAPAGGAGASATLVKLVARAQDALHAMPAPYRSRISDRTGGAYAKCWGHAAPVCDGRIKTHR